MGLYQGILESSDGGAFVNLRDAAGTGLTSTLISSKQALDVNVANSISVGVADETAFTYGTSTFLPVGGVFNSSITALTSGQSGAVSLTAQRAVWSNLRNSSGTELGNSSGTALFVQDTNAASILALMQAATGTITSPTLTTSSATALASNAGRKAFSIYNPTAFSVLLAFAATASAVAYTILVRPNQLYEQNSNRIYTGIVTMITPGVTGSPTIMVTEET